MGRLATIAVLVVLAASGVRAQEGHAPEDGMHRRHMVVPTVQLGAVVTLEPGLSRAVARRVLRVHLNEIRFCYEHELAATPELRVRGTLTLTIAATGAVSEAHAELAGDHGAAVPPSLAECVQGRATRWVFPAPTRAPARFRVPLVLTERLGPG